MSHGSKILSAALGVAAAVLLLPENARAYGGPGSVISGVGALLAAMAAIGAAIFGFLWFPLKRLYERIRGSGSEEEMPVEP